MGVVQNVQALRGVAALLVVALHLKFAASGIDKNSTFPGLMFGAAGVDIFFVISGYVIAMTAIKREHGAGGFFLARVARVCPLYFLLTLPWVLFKHESISSLWNGLFYLPILDRGDYSPAPLDVGWTLSFEMWFYTVFAVLMVFCPPRRVALLLPLFFFLGAGLMTFYRGTWFFPRFMFHPFVIEFALGCLVFLGQAWLSRRSGWVLVILAAILFLFSWPESSALQDYSVLLNHRLDLAWWRVLVWGAPAALLVAGAVGIERHGGWTFPRWLTGLGGISYSLYLVHRFVPSLVAHLFAVTGCKNLPAACAAMVGFSLLLAYVCWRWIERPLTSYAQAWVTMRYHVPIREVVVVREKIARPEPEPAVATV